jgi:hypothetical protein
MCLKVVLNMMLCKMLYECLTVSCAPYLFVCLLVFYIFENTGKYDIAILEPSGT